MGNSIINMSEEQRAKFGCSLVNKGKRLGLLTDALVAAATSFQDLLDDIRAIADSNAINPSMRFLFEALVRELKWLHGKDILTDSVVTGLTTVNTASAATDLRFLFSNLVQADATFDPSREDYTAEASGATSY